MRTTSSNRVQARGDFDSRPSKLLLEICCELRFVVLDETKEYLLADVVFIAIVDFASCLVELMIG